MILLVAMCLVAGCVYMLESVFLFDFEGFGVRDSLGERIAHIFCWKCGAYFQKLVYA